MDFLSTASDIKKGVKKLEWITKLAEALEEIGSIEQAAKETKAKKIEADEALVSVAMAVSEQEAELKSIKSEAKAAKDKADKEMAEQKESAKSLLESYQAQIEEAKEQALSIIQQANSQAHKTIKESDELLEEKKRELELISGRIDDAIETLEATNRQIEEAKAKAKALFRTFD